MKIQLKIERSFDEAVIFLGKDVYRTCFYNSDDEYRINNSLMWSIKGFQTFPQCLRKPKKVILRISCPCYCEDSSEVYIFFGTSNLDLTELSYYYGRKYQDGYCDVERLSKW